MKIIRETQAKPMKIMKGTQARPGNTMKIMRETGQRASKPKKAMKIMRGTQGRELSKTQKNIENPNGDTSNKMHKY